MARAPSPTPSTLLEEINKLFRGEDALGIRREFCEKLQKLGINLETNTAIKKSGFHATTFLVPQKNIVIKFFGNECEESNVKFPNDSRYMLQPLCYTDIVGNQLAIFPLLKTFGVTDDHAAELHASLDTEGYFFSDRKLENIGLTNGGIPYVIDNDAVTKVRDCAAPESRRKVQWNCIDPVLLLDHAPTERSGWKFDSTVQLGILPVRSPDAERLVDLERKKKSASTAKL